MMRWKRYRWLVALFVGLVAGLTLSGFWPHTPLYAVATDRVETLVMATGPLDSDVEAVYFLDLLTGDLRAVVLGRQPGAWTGYFWANVATDLGLRAQDNPKFLMTTGICNLRRGGGSRVQPSVSMCYVAEITSGKVIAYTVPWSPSMYAGGQPQNWELKNVGVTSFRQPIGTTPAAKGARARN